jgi:hypothetical protein
MQLHGFSIVLNIGILLAAILSVGFISHITRIEVYAQPMSMMNNTMAQQHAAHTLDNLIVSEHIPLNGQLDEGDYILLMDFTPFATSVEGHSHIALKVPCNADASSKISIVTGSVPNFHTLDIGNAIINGTLDSNNILNLSNPGRSCLYHAELPKGATDVILVNTSNRTLNFDEGKYSVTVSAHGTAIQHIAANQTHMGF